MEPNDNESTIEDVDVAAIRRYLASTDVRFALLFGSRVRGNTHESSDVDMPLRFPGNLSPTERFRRRNRIDAGLQGYADDFVDVSDIDGRSLPIARAALEHGIRLVGNPTLSPPDFGGGGEDVRHASLIGRSDSFRTLAGKRLI